jgi:TetR/AcrR family transcriptional regulator
MPAARHKLTNETANHHGARARLFNAAVREFATHGLAGARTDAIAKAAGVNIALLFYYYSNKERLYAAVMEEVFAQWSQALRKPLGSKGSPRQRILTFVETFYDFVAASVWRPRLVQQELMRSTHPVAIRKLLKTYVRPIHTKFMKTLRDGIADGSFRELDVENFYYSTTAIITHYFSNSSAIAAISGTNPVSLARVKARKRAVLDLISAGLLNPSARQVRTQLKTWKIK